MYRAIRVDGTRPPRQVAIRAALDPADSTAAARVQREYEVLRVLDDPRVPRVYGHYPEAAAMAMGFVDGVTLADIIHASTKDWVALEPATSLDIVIEVAHALRHAHSVRFGAGSRIVHGHLGPQRIRLEPTGNVVVVGLGAASRGRHPAYTAPEIARGGMPLRESDQWSLGATLVEMLLGERLYTGRSSQEEAARAGDVHPWLSRVERSHAQIAPVLRKMLACSADARFRSEPEMLKALLEASRRMGGTVHRRHLVAQVSIHADKLHAMRPSRPPVLPLPNDRGTQLPEVQPGHSPTTVPQEPEVPEMSQDTPPPAELPPMPAGPDLDEPASVVDIPISAPDDDFHPELPSPEPETKAAPGPTFSEDSALDPELEPTAPVLPPNRGPEPTAAFLPSEIAGMVGGIAMLGLAIWYCLKVL